MVVNTIAIKTVIAIVINVFAFATLPVAADLLVSNATVRLLPPGVPNTSAYFTIENSGQQDRFLVAAKASFAKNAEIHAHTLEGDMMRMERQQQVRIPAGQRVTFQPGGLHVMMFGLTSALQANQQVQFALITKNNQQIDVSAQVVKPGDEGAPHRHH